MKNKIIIIFTLSLFTSYLIAEELSNDAIELGKILQTTNSITADFKQNVYNQDNKKLQTTNGFMMVKKPNQFRWEIIKPDPNLIIVNKGKFFNYDQELQQITIQNIDNIYENSPVSLFLTANIQDINTRYFIKKRKVNCFELIPRNESDGFKNVQLTFKNNIIISLRLTDQLEQISKIKFSNIKINIKLKDQFFRFDIPKGVDVIEY